MKRGYLYLLLLFLSTLSADSNITYENLTLDRAIEIVQDSNLEINIAEFDKDIADLGVKVARGYSFGKLDATLMGLRSNDAGNVFGFKLQSREATFGDFGFRDFLGGVSEAIGNSAGDFALFSQIMANPDMANRLLSTSPKDLNFPDTRSHFDLKLTYMLPLYTGGKLSNYRAISKRMLELKKEDANKVKALKIYEVKKTFYDISLLYQFEKDLEVIKGNITKLKDATTLMKDEGYAKSTDVLEVESKLSNIERMFFQAHANRELSYQFLSFLLNSDVKSIKRVSLDELECKVSIDEIKERNRDIKRAKLGKEIQSNMVNVLEANFKPEIGAFAEYGSSDDKFLNDFKAHDRYTVGIQAKLNILNGGSDFAKLQQEKIKFLKAKKQLDLATKGTLLKYKKIKTEIANLEKQIDSIKKEKELAQKIYLSYQERYKEGLSSINDVVIKQSLQIEKILKLLELQNSKLKKMLEIQKMVY